MSDAIQISERHTHQSAVRCMRRHHALHLFQGITELSITVLRRRGRFSVERSEGYNLVDYNAAAGSPQELLAHCT
jgi:hypothetical protein